MQTKMNLSMVTATSTALSNVIEHKASLKLDGLELTSPVDQKGDHNFKCVVPLPALQCHNYFCQ